MSIVFPLELQSIESAGFQQQFSDHIRFQFTAVLPEEHARNAIASITEETTVEVQITEGEESRPYFCGFVERAELSMQGKWYLLSVSAVSYTAKLDRKKRSRSFYKTDVSWEEVLTCIKESEKTGDSKFRCGATFDIKQSIGVPIMQYQETDWEFIKRMAALWGMVVTPDATVAYPSFWLGYPQTGQPAELKAEELGMVRDIQECMEEHYQAGKTEKDCFDELYYTGVFLRSRVYRSLGSSILINRIAFVITYVEGYEENGEFWYDYIAKAKDAIHAVYQGNLQIAGCSLEATVKERKGNVVSLRLDIDKGNPYYAKEDGRDLFFTYALDSKGYYCMPESGSRVRLYLPSEREWEAFAVSAVRMAGEEAERADRISIPDNKSFLNSSGVGVELTPEQITLSPDDGNEISIQLEKNGTITIKGKTLTFAGVGITIGKKEEGECCKTISFHADSLLYAARCIVDPETGAMEPIEDHFLAMEAISQIYAGSGIRHTSTGSPKVPSVSYDDSALIAQEAAEAEANNLSYQEALIARKSSGAAKFGKGLLMVAVGALAVVATGGAALGVAVAVGCAAFGGALMEEGKQDRAYAEAGDLTTEAFNPLKKLIPEPAYTLLENAFCIAGSVIVAGPTVLIGPIANTGVSMAFDFFQDGRLDTPWETYLNGFATQCMVSSISMKIGKAGSCESYWSKVKSDIIQQTTSSIIGGIGNGQLTVEGLVEDFITQVISAPLSNLTEHKVWSALIDTGLDSTVDVASQVYHNGWEHVDWKQVLQTGVATMVTKLFYSCDPVCVSKGFLFQYREDLWFEDLYGRFAIERRYMSTFAYDGSFGKGWYHGYESFLIGEKGRLTVMLQDGHLETFFYQNQQWENERKGDKKYVLVEDKEKKEFCLIAQEAGTYYENTYNEFGQLIRVKDRKGAIRSTILTYKKQEDCSKIRMDTRKNRRLYSEIDIITTPGGRVIHFAYQNGRMVRLWDEFGREVRYEYQENRLFRAIYPDGGMQTYSYDKNGYLVSMNGENGVPFIVNQYDTQGRVIRQRYPDGNEAQIQYDLEKRKTTIMFSETGRTEQYFYNPQSLIIHAIYGEEREEQYSYDKWGNKIEEIDRNGNKKVWNYDAYGYILEERSPGGLKTIYTYDDNHLLIQEEDNCKGRRTYQYDKAGNCIEERIEIEEGKWQSTSYTYDLYGRILTIQDARGNCSSYEYKENTHHAPSIWKTEEQEEFLYTYDEIGRRTSITSSYGTVRLDYTATGYVNRITDALGHTTRKIVDQCGNVLKVVLPNSYQAELDSGEGYRYRYDYMDRLIQVTDPYGTIFRQKWDMDGNLIQVIHPNAYDIEKEDGTGIKYVYDRSQYRIKEIRPDGGIQRFIRDCAGNLVKVILPEEYARAGEEGKGITYDYDKEHRLKEVRNAEGEVVYRFLYDFKGRLRKEINGEGYLSADTDEERYGILYYYNCAGWLVEKREPVKENSFHQAAARTILYQLTTYEYDLVGNCIAEHHYQEFVTKTQQPKSTPLTISFTYDKRNRLLQVCDSLGAAVEYQYDSLNQRTSERIRIQENLSRKTESTYDAAGQLIQVKEYEEYYDREKQRWEKKANQPEAITRFAYDKNGNQTEWIRPEGSKEIREYNRIDQLVKVIQEDTKSGIYRIITYTYDKAGNRITESDQRGTIHYRYNLLNQLIEKEDREGGIYRLFYDKDGNLIRWIDAEQYERKGEDAVGTTFTYDEFGRLEKTYDPSGYLQEWNHYGRNGQLIRKENGDGLLVEYGYDIGGRQTSITTAEAKQAGRISQSYQYDAQGNVIGSKDGEGNTTHYELDGWGRITTIFYPDGSKERFAYNSAGNFTTTTDGKGGTITYCYNSQNRVSEVIDQVGEKESYRYDREGRMISHFDRNGNQITYVWGMDGNLLRKKAVISEEKEANDNQLMYRYDTEGQLIEASGGGVCYRYDYTPNGWLKNKYINGKRVLSYTYTRNGLVKTLIDSSGKKTEYEYDLQNRPIYIKDSGKRLVEYIYNKDHTIKEIRFANGIVTSYTYDRDANLTNLLTIGKEGKVLLSYRYAYDGNGNRILKQGEKGSLSVGQTNYHYDKMQRLAQVSYPDGKEESYRYDLAGNRVYKRYGNLEESYTYDKRNRLLERVIPFTEQKSGAKNSEHLHITYTYDSQGNTKTEWTERIPAGIGKQPESLQRKSYYYTSFQQTSKVEVENFENQTKEIQENFYDAENLRYAIRENGEQTNFVTDGWNIYSEENEDWDWKKRLIRGYGITASEEREKECIEAEYHYYHVNEHEDIEVLTGKKGGVLNCYQYDAFGNIISAEELKANRYTYYGEVYDCVTEQYYLRARNYNPQIARFTQEDVYRGDGLNLYVYCLNNAVMYIDPSGYDYGDFSQDVRIYYKKCFDENTKVEHELSSTILRYNILRKMGIPDARIPEKLSPAPYQTQHLIPREMKFHEVITDLGFQLDHAENGIMALRCDWRLHFKNKLKDNFKVNSENLDYFFTEKTYHCGSHPEYSKFVESVLDEIKVVNSKTKRKEEFVKFLSILRKMHQDGIKLNRLSKEEKERYQETMREKLEKYRKEEETQKKKCNGKK